MEHCGIQNRCILGFVKLVYDTIATGASEVIWNYMGIINPKQNHYPTGKPLNMELIWIQNTSVK